MRPQQLKFKLSHAFGEHQLHILLLGLGCAKGDN